MWDYPSACAISGELGEGENSTKAWWSADFETSSTITKV